MVLRMVSKDEIKNRFTKDKCLGVKVWRNWMDAHHVAGGEPLSRVRVQGQAMSWFNLMGCTPPPSTSVLRTFPSLSRGEAAFSQVWTCPCGD